MRFYLNDGTKIPIPPTMMIDTLLTEPRRSEERAPFSSVVVTAGDGLPEARPFNVAGKAYFNTAQQANDWFLTIRDRLEDITYLEIDSFLIEVLAVDMTAVPVLLPRVLNVSFRVYPGDVIPLYFEEGWRWLEADLDTASTEAHRQVGYDFVVKRDVRVTGFRVFRNNTDDVEPRDVAIWRVEDQSLMGRFNAGWTTSTVGWTERRFAPGILLSGGITYRLATSNGSELTAFHQTRLAQPGVVVDDHIELGISYGSSTFFPNFPDASHTPNDSRYFAVDMYLELP